MGSTATFVFKNGYFTSPNQSVAPQSPNFPSTWNLDNLDPTALKSYSWDLAGLPYLPFVLSSPFHGRLLKRLALSVDCAQFDTNGSLFFLSEDTTESWRRLERILVDLGDNLRSFFEATKPSVSLAKVKRPSLPSFHGYAASHDNKATATLAFSVSQDAFIIYSAYISFLVALCEFGIASRSGSKPSWLVHLSDPANCTLHAEWLAMFRESPIVNFKASRRGVILDVAGIPLWFYWGRQPEFVTPSESWLSRFYPNTSVCLEGPSATTFSTAPTPTSTETAGPRVSAPFPPVCPGSSQRDGETMEEFFARRRRNHEAWKAKEDPMKRRAREDAEKAAAKRPYIGKKGPIVYEWDLTDGYRIRTPVSRNAANETFHGYRSHQSIYDSFANCWDCCSDFGDDIPGRDDDFESDSDEGPSCTVASLAPVVSSSGGPSLSSSHVVSSTSTSSDTHTQPPNIIPVSLSPRLSSVTNVPESSSSLEQALSPRLSSVTNVHELLSSLEQNETEDGEIETDDLLSVSRQDVLSVNNFEPTSFKSAQDKSLEDLLYFRFGYSLDERPYSGPPQSLTPAKFTSWDEVLRSVGARQLTTSWKDKVPIEDFLGCLLVSKEPLDEIPGKFWDLGSYAMTPLSEMQPCFVSVHVKHFDNAPHYILRPRNLHESRDVSWLLSVDAMTALECMRRSLGPHIYDITNFLVDHGIPFRTFLPLPSDLRTSLSSSSKRSSPRSLLGRRSKKYNFDLGDFATYQTLLHALLRANPESRAALCIGGIVARIARDILPNSAALLGPSHEALDGKQQVLESDGQIFCDDELSQDMLDLICGVYEVETGYGDQVLYISWFPRHNIWNHSGINVGQWTPDCEHWFREQVIAIQNGSPPLEQNKWQNKMNLTRKADSGSGGLYCEEVEVAFL
ncbi:hypothetical protein CVT25_007322 [Psilocybe cyanescens]|uniref:Uncharacterized protein n=1 Tax=Psilocybe cyanescens TaxID=93625 RepID=A0A409VXT9_PSICY|nr:hypothetical protein CVT25_007322 [Psilocybe cyanescens]